MTRMSVNTPPPRAFAAALGEPAAVTSFSDRSCGTHPRDAQDCAQTFTIPASGSRNAANAFTESPY